MSEDRTTSPRVCMLIESYSPIIGGMESQARFLSAGLSRKGVSHRILTRRVASNLPKYDVIEDVPVIRVGPVGTKGSGRWGMVLSVLPWLLRHAGTYDVVLTSGFRTLGLAAVLARKRTGKPCILKADSRGEMSGSFFAPGLKKRGLDPDGPIIRRALNLRRKWLAGADAFISLSEEMTQEFRQSGVPPDRIHQIPNGVDTDVYAPVSEQKKRSLREGLKISPETIVFVYTGRLVTYKGLPALFDAWNQFQQGRRNLLLWIVGGGGTDIHSCESDLRDYVSAHGLGESIRFAGETGDVARCLQASDVFVFPTEEEAFGLSLLEAMACGLPSISTRVGGLREILFDGRNGIAIPPGSSQAIANAMRDLLKDPARREALGRNAAAAVRDRYSMDAVCDRYISLLRKIAPASRVETNHQS